MSWKHQEAGTQNTTVVRYGPDYERRVDKQWDNQPIDGSLTDTGLPWMRMYWYAVFSVGPHWGMSVKVPFRVTPDLPPDHVRPITSRDIEVASSGPDHLDIFILGRDRKVYHRAWEGSASGWSAEWYSLGGAMATTPVVASSAPQRMDLFAVAMDGTLFYQYGLAGFYTFTWDLLGGPLKPGTEPSVASWGRDRLDVFITGVDGHVLHKAWNGTGWLPSQTGWDDLGGSAVSSPVAVSWGPNRLDVFIREPDGLQYHKAWDGGAWLPSHTGWAPTGGLVDNNPAVVSWGPDRIDLLSVNAGLGLGHMAWTGTAWLPTQQGWDSLVPNSALGSFDVVPVAWGPNRLDVFFVGSDYHVHDKLWDGVRWQTVNGAYDLGAVVRTEAPYVSNPAAVSWGPNRLDLVHVGRDNAVYHKAWDGARWLPSVLGWDNLGGQVLGFHNT